MQVMPIMLEHCRFKDIFQEVYEEKWKSQFEEQSIWLASLLSSFTLLFPKTFVNKYSGSFYQV